MGTTINGVSFTEAELQMIGRITATCWDVIAGDCLVDDDGNPDYGASCSRYDMFELSMDAGRWAMYCNGEEKEAMTKILEKVKSLGWRSEDWKKLVEKVTPFSTYGY